jgi:hypothetical protein
MPQSTQLLNCEDYKAANLIMIHIPDHLVGFYNINCGQASRSETGEACETSETDFHRLDQA